MKLSVGAHFTEDAYEVQLHPALAQLDARPELRRAAYEYVDQCMSTMFGSQWKQMIGLSATNNVVQMPGTPVVLEFGDGVAGAW